MLKQAWRREETLNRYHGPNGESMVAWREIRCLFDDYGATGELGNLLSAILADDYWAARDACACLLAGDKP